MVSKLCKLYYDNRDAFKDAITKMCNKDILIIASLDNGGLSPIEISKKSGVSKFYTSRRLKELVMLGLLDKVIKGNDIKYKQSKRKTNVTIPESAISRCLSEIRSVYPNNRAFLQPAIALREIKKILQPIFKTKGEEGVTELIKKITEYIEYAKSNRDWSKSNGKYVPGLGNFLISRVWEETIISKATDEHNHKSKLSKKIEEFF